MCSKVLTAAASCASTHRYRTLVQTAFSLMRMLMGDYEFDRFWEVSECPLWPDTVSQRRTRR